jgi:hypothetical protein
MKINELRDLVKKNLQLVLEERKTKKLKEQQLKNSLSSLISEVMDEKKRDFEKTFDDIVEKLSSSVNKLNKSYAFSMNDAGNFSMCGCEPYHIDVRPRWYNNFEVLAYKDTSDRTKKVGLDFDGVIEFLKDYLTTDGQNYVDTAFNKSVDNSKDKEDKKSKGGTEFDTEADDAVEKKEDMPDQPLQQVQIKKIEKQSDHSVKGEKVKYKAPKKSNDDLTVKFK